MSAGKMVSAWSGNRACGSAGDLRNNSLQRPVTGKSTTTACHDDALSFAIGDRSVENAHEGMEKAVLVPTMAQQERPQRASVPSPENVWKQPFDDIRGLRSMSSGDDTEGGEPTFAAGASVTKASRQTGHSTKLCERYADDRQVGRETVIRHGLNRRQVWV